jgi:hypothetical protein
VTLLGQETLTVTPYTVAEASGVLVPSAGTPFTVIGTVLPISDRTLQMLDEGTRASARFELYVEGTDPAPDMSATGSAADRTTWNGRTYKLIGVRDYTQHTTGIPHKRYVLAEVGSDE